MRLEMFERGGLLEFFDQLRLNYIRLELLLPKMELIVAFPGQ